jgi:predicted alpha/beta superfamily hydrolase
MPTKPAFTLPSFETGTDYWIYVDAPEATQSPGPWIPVLFLDGDDQFPEAVKAYRALPAEAHVPPLLLIGVGYGASYGQAGNKRARDYTPVQAHAEKESGGAEKFLAFVTQTLWPQLESRYSLKPGVRGIGGYSLSALFVLYALFQEKAFFTHHLAGSPSIWWGDRALLQQVAALHARNPAVKGKAFVSVGEKDSPSMTGDLVLLEKQLASLAFPNLDITIQRFPKKNHFNALPLAFATGFPKLFGKP